jgi:hypothetical protein
MHMKGIRIILFGIAAGLVASACYFDNEEDVYEYWYAANQCDTVAITYNEHIEPIIRGQCAISGCHVAGGTGNGIFESYEGVKDKVNDGSLLRRTVVDRDMPPSGPLSDCQIKQIQAWIAEGAPEN